MIDDCWSMIEKPKQINDLVLIRQSIGVFPIKNHQSTMFKAINNHQSTINNPGGFMIKVLLVEDNAVFRESFRRTLTNRFHSIVTEDAESGEEALEKVKANPPDLIFMDLRLPGINGLETIKKIKKAFPEVRIAMLTGYDLPEYRQAATEYGADGFLIKESLKWDEIEVLIKRIDDL